MMSEASVENLEMDFLTEREIGVLHDVQLHNSMACVSLSLTISEID